MELRVRVARPWLRVLAVAALFLLSTGVGPSHVAAAQPSGAGAVCPDTAPAARSSDTAQSQGTGVRIPRDEAPHRDRAEWWYYVGHLRGVDPQGRPHCYGFEQVVFQFLDKGPEPLYIGHFALSDLTRGTFQYAGTPDSHPIPDTTDGFALDTGDWTMRGGSGKATLHAALPEYELDLQLRSAKPAVLHGDRGTIPYGPLGTSKYYSWTSAQAVGTIVDHGVPVQVTGLSWGDHQWGDNDFTIGAGWDWFSVQLTDGKQYMLYFVRDTSGKIVETIGTLIHPSGRTTKLSPAKLSTTDTGSWTSPRTGITYGSGWQVTVPGGRLTVTPNLVDQELDLLSTVGAVYWEGSVSVRGEIAGSPVTGIGYTEIYPPRPT
ncbi:lipocalin family protein [Streptomyces sp. NPDC057456]|uniref:lipocalin family protein n=1 Tax=Streptomyces sp. NPDC057456 TaxID=3346139 RepID=UPI0036CE0EAA